MHDPIGSHTALIIHNPHRSKNVGKGRKQVLTSLAVCAYNSCGTKKGRGTTMDRLEELRNQLADLWGVDPEQVRGRIGDLLADAERGAGNVYVAWGCWEGQLDSVI